MRHFLKAWRVQAYLDFLFLTRDLKHALTYLVSDIVLTVTAVTGVLLLAERFDGIGAWSKPQVLFMLGFASLSKALVETFFGYNILWISRRIGRGQLDHNLIQPRPLWAGLVTEGFIPFAMCLTSIPGVGLMFWALPAVGIHTNFAWWAAFALNLFAAGGILLAFSFIWGSLAFWAPAGAEEISSSAVDLMGGLNTFPLDGLGAGMKAALLSFLPVGFLAWYPSSVLLGIRETEYAIFVTPLAALILGIAAAAIFNRGMAHYAHNGSPRYLDRGHRR